MAGILLCSTAFSGRSQAGLVYWGSAGFVQNADSKARAWTAAFSMSLGVFKSGFVPTAENRGEWKENWSELGVASFDAAEARFAGVVDVSKPLPADAGARVYFWAKNGDDLTKGPEWLLLTRPDWQWPVGSVAESPALTWTTDSSATPVLGAVDSLGKHLVTSRVAPVPVGQEQWLAGFFPDRPAKADPDADPDGDGLSNRMEYFLGSDPDDASSTISPEIRTTGGATVLKLRRNAYASTKFAVETSTNLKAWTAGGGEVLEDRPDLIEVSLGKQPKSAFFRFKLEGGKP